MFTREISIVKSHKVCFSFVLDYLDDGKIKKLSQEQFESLFHFLLMDVYIQERSGQSNCTRSLTHSLDSD